MLNVTPGSSFNGRIGVRAKHCGFTLEGFYNFFAREKEGVALRTPWSENEYAYILKSFDIYQDNDEFIAGGTSSVNGPIQAEGNTSTDDVASNGVALTAPNLLTYYVTTEACSTKAQRTHTVGGSAGFTFDKLRVPVTLTAGGSYEFDPSDDNTAITSWSAWGKVGFCF